MSAPFEIDATAASHNLLRWWKINQRKFPWRKTNDPYHILISEVFLHRTKAEQVVPVYIEFLKNFPTIETLSQSNIEHVKRLIYPLGLHWRTPLLHQMSRIIIEQYGGQIPSTKRQLESLPGVSHYIASAVLCFAFGIPVAVLDTNTVRIFGRNFGIQITDTSRRRKCFQDLANFMLDKDNPREFNYALIDLGALVCKPKKPACCLCPLNKMCRLGLQIIHEINS